MPMKQADIVANRSESKISKDSLQLVKYTFAVYINIRDRDNTFLSFLKDSKQLIHYILGYISI